jgi:hypothetical protein
MPTMQWADLPRRGAHQEIRRAERLVPPLSGLQHSHTAQGLEESVHRLLLLLDPLHKGAPGIHNFSFGPDGA